MEAGPSQQVVQHTEVDVPGALLEEPLNKHSGIKTVVVMLWHRDAKLCA